MRSQKNRSRSKSNRSSNNNRSMGNIVNRVFDSSGPEGKVRGTPQQIIDKYNQLTRDAQLSNDRVAAENFQQHAEHYARMLGEAQREQDARRVEQEALQQQQQQAREARQSRDDDAPQDQGGKPVAQERSDAAPEQKSFADVIDVPASGDSGLVSTPESAPRPKRPRTRRAPKKAADAPAEGQGDAPSSPEEGPQAAE